MSDGIQIVIALVFLVAVFILTRVGIAWKLRRAAGSIIKELESQGAVDVVSAAELPYSKPSLLRIGMRDYNYKALELLMTEGAVGKTAGNKYYLCIATARERDHIDPRTSG
ncbi:MAG: hypothetical protein V1792_17210 [Pseudomonadota bacterium]